jgi:hypothetical protein
MACFCSSPVFEVLYRTLNSNQQPLAPVRPGLLRPSLGPALKSASTPRLPDPVRLHPLRPQPRLASSPLQPMCVRCRRHTGPACHPLPPPSSTRAQARLPRCGLHAKRSTPALFKAPPPPKSSHPNPSHLSSSALPQTLAPRPPSICLAAASPPSRSTSRASLGRVEVTGVIGSRRRSPQYPHDLAGVSPPQALASRDHVWFEDRWMVASLCDE